MSKKLTDKVRLLKKMLGMEVIKNIKNAVASRI